MNNQQTIIDTSKHPRQDAFVFDDSRFTAFIGGIGSGKTYAGSAKVLRFCDRPTRGMIVAPTYPMLKDATIETLRDVVGPLWRSDKYNKSDMTGQIGMAQVLFRSGDRPDRLRGPNLDWFWGDEIALCDRLVWQVGIGRLRRGGRAGPAWITGTPKGRNWVWEEFVDKGHERDNYHIYHAKTADNPYLDEIFVADLHEAYTGFFAKQELEGQFVTFEGLVFDAFRRELHIKKPPVELSAVVAGVDWGYTNPAVILVVGQDGDGRTYVIDEWYQRRKLIGEQIEAAHAMRKTWDIERFWCDASRPDNIKQFNLAGLPASPYTGKRSEGIKEIRSRLAVMRDGLPRHFIAPHCLHTIAEMESYCNKQVKGEYTDEPEKQNDHAMDSGRYAVSALSRGRGKYYG